jgi:hypothetical protein
MLLAEVLIEKQNLEAKIQQLENYIYRVYGSSAEQTDKATNKFLELTDKYRSHLILINRVNNEVELTIGDSKVNLANAVLIIKTIKKKIDLLDNLIETADSETVMDTFNLIEQRDKLLEEYDLISNEVKALEWGTEVD